MNTFQMRCNIGALRSLCVAIAILSAQKLTAASALDFSLGGGHLENHAVSYTLGWEFSIEQPITVTHLRLFDLGRDGLVESHRIGIWTINGPDLGPFVEGIVPAGPTALLDGSFRYTQIPTVILQPGSYVIGGVYVPGSLDSWAAEVSEVTTDPHITFVSPRWTRLVGSELRYPRIAGAPNSYFGPNFQFEPIPERSATALLSLSSIAWVIGALARRHHKRTYS